MLSTAITESEARFRADPAAALSTPTVTATLVNGRARLTSGSFNWDADLPAALGGAGLAPSPTAYLLGALAGCAVAFLRDTLAPQFDVEIADVRAVASASSDARGLLAIDDAKPDLGQLALDIQVTTESPDRPGRCDARRLGRSVPDLPCPAEGERGEPDDLDSQIARTTHRRRFRARPKGRGRGPRGGPRAKGRAQPNLLAIRDTHELRGYEGRNPPWGAFRLLGIRGSDGQQVDRANLRRQPAGYAPQR